VDEMLMQLWRPEFDLDGTDSGMWLINIDVSSKMTGRVYSSCVQSNMLQRSEIWSVRKENEVALQRQI